MQSYIVALLALAATGAHATPFQQPSQRSRILNARAEGNTTTGLQKSYDFVIIGGGLAGLVVGNRLSANPDYSVLVIEAGSDGTEYGDEINVPGNAYWGDLWDLPVNWAFTTTSQPGLNGAQMTWPRGKVLGGSSAINGLYLTRPGELEMNAWQSLLGDMPGASNWGWNSMLAAMKKSETFTPPTAAIAKEGGISFDASSRGTSGPLQVSYPGIASPLMADWTASAAAAGLPANKDAYNGEMQGAFICTSTLNAANYTRSYSASAYLDPLPPRSNYDVLTNALVTKVNFDTSKKPMMAMSVEYTTDGGATMQTVGIDKDVVLSAGSVGSPTILQHSGVGPSDVLKKAGVKVLYELPGVGQHLQDHPSSQMVFKSSTETIGDQWLNQGGDNATGIVTSYVNDAIAYVDSKTLLGNGAGALKTSILANLNKYAPDDSSVAAGYTAVSKKIATDVFDSTTGQVELLMGLAFTNSSVNLQVTLQHGYSQGSINIVSNDPTAYPAINPNYLANPADIAIMTAGLRKVREIANTAPLSGLLTEFSPGTGVQTDEEFSAFLAQSLYTEFHPACTCSMLPENQGGVVDATLLVYGTGNVRVADASIPPIEFASHLMGSTYGIGEKASEVILQYWHTAGQKNGNKKSTKQDKKPSVQAAQQHAKAVTNGAVSMPGASVVSVLFALLACVAIGL